MSDLNELRRALAEREQLAPDSAGILLYVRRRGRRLRRLRRLIALAGAGAAAVALLALSSVVTRTATGLGHAPGRQGVSVAWGIGEDSGPITLAPLRTRAVPLVIPYSVRLPFGWRELSYAVQVGQFQARFVHGISVVTMDIVPLSINRVPTGDPRTGEPNARGTLSWRTLYHYVRLSTPGQVDRVLYREVVATLDFHRPRVLRAPVSTQRLPAGSYVYAAAVTLPPAVTGYRPPEGWGMGVWAMVEGQQVSFQLSFGPPYSADELAPALLLSATATPGSAQHAANSLLARSLLLAADPADPRTWLPLVRA
jgi:hypothetical protein